MTIYLARRVFQALAVVMLVSVIVFALSRALPGDTARAILGPTASPEAVANYKREHGLDKPVPVQYVSYLGHVVRGDLGESDQVNQGVASLIGERLPRTLVIATASQLFAITLAIILGTWQATRRNRPEDRALSVLGLALYSTPPFWLALILITFFSIHLGWFPAAGPQGDLSSYPSQLSSLVLPILSLGLISTAFFTRYVRSSIADNLLADYVLTARAKGLSTFPVLARHVLRNGILPIITVLGLSLPWVLSGAVITERIFNIQGMGMLFWQSATGRDFPVLLGVSLVVAVAAVLGSLAADVIYAVVDPRIRLGRD